jgi:hypothetical protein
MPMYVTRTNARFDTCKWTHIRQHAHAHVGAGARAHVDCEAVAGARTTFCGFRLNFQIVRVPCRQLRTSAGTLLPESSKRVRQKCRCFMKLHPGGIHTANSRSITASGFMAVCKLQRGETFLEICFLKCGMIMTQHVCDSWMTLPYVLIDYRLTP